nr:acyl-CoA synthetase 5 [Cryptomeria japonica]
MADQNAVREEEEIIFRSPFPAVLVPENISLPEFVLRTDWKENEKFSNNVALVEASTGKEYTYDQVFSLTKKVAGGLVQTVGVLKGDVVLVVLPNMAEYPIIVLGIMLAGAVFSGSNPAAHVTEIEKQVRDSGAKFLVTVSSVFYQLCNLEFMASITVIMADDHSKVEGKSVPLATLFETDDSVIELPVVGQNDLCALPYSSGTTGASKGVMLTHRNLIANLCSTLFDVDESLLGKFTTLGLMPFFHIYGITGICCATLRNKGKVVVMSRFDLRLFMDVLINCGVNFAPIVPPIMLALVKNPIVEEYDLSRLQLKAIMTAAAPLAPDLQRAFHEKFPGVEVQEAYGLTEHSCITLTHCSPDNNIRGIAKKKSVGFILPNLEVKFVDPETGKSLPRNCQGELCVRSQCVMQGYYQKPRETETTVDSQGWLHTGDVGFIDDDGDVFIVDRIKELIKYKGFQVAPAELEAILLSHPSVDDAAVVPLADEEAGEIPAACVVKKAGGTESEDDMLKFVASQVASYKKVRVLHFVPSIPKSSSGKILRRLVRDNLLNLTKAASN